MTRPLFATSRRLLLGIEQLAVDQHLGDLDRVECGALAQIVRYAPQAEPVLDGGVLTDAADIGGVLAGRFIGRDIAAALLPVDDEATRRVAQDGARLIH